MSLELLAKSFFEASEENQKALETEVSEKILLLSKRVLGIEEFLDILTTYERGRRRWEEGEGREEEGGAREEGIMKREEGGGGREMKEEGKEEEGIRKRREEGRRMEEGGSRREKGGNEEEEVRLEGNLLEFIRKKEDKRRKKKEDEGMREEERIRVEKERTEEEERRKKDERSKEERREEEGKKEGRTKEGRRVEEEMMEEKERRKEEGGREKENKTSMSEKNEDSSRQDPRVWFKIKTLQALLSSHPNHPGLKGSSLVDLVQKSRFLMMGGGKRMVGGWRRKEEDRREEDRKREIEGQEGGGRMEERGGREGGGVMREVGGGKREEDRLGGGRRLAGGSGRREFEDVIRQILQRLREDMSSLDKRRKLVVSDLMRFSFVFDDHILDYLHCYCLLNMEMMTDYEIFSVLQAIARNGKVVPYEMVYRLRERLGGKRKEDVQTKKLEGGQEAEKMEDVRRWNDGREGEGREEGGGRGKGKLKLMGKKMEGGGEKKEDGGRKDEGGEKRKEEGDIKDEGEGRKEQGVRMEERGRHELQGDKKEEGKGRMKEEGEERKEDRGRRTEEGAARKDEGLQIIIEEKGELEEEGLGLTTSQMIEMMRILRKGRFFYFERFYEKMKQEAFGNRVKHMKPIDLIFVMFYFGRIYNRSEDIGGKVIPLLENQLMSIKSLNMIKVLLMSLIDLKIDLTEEFIAKLNERVDLGFLMDEMRKEEQFEPREEEYVKQIIEIMRKKSIKTVA